MQCQNSTELFKRPELILMFQIHKSSQDGWWRLGSLWVHLQPWNGNATTAFPTTKLTGTLTLLYQSTKKWLPWQMQKISAKLLYTTRVHFLPSFQSTCTDNECFTDGLPGPANATGKMTQSEINFWLIQNFLINKNFPFSGGDGDPSGGFMMMAMAWMVMAMMMYFMRPNSLRGEPQGKPQGRSTFSCNYSSLKIRCSTVNWEI